MKYSKLKQRYITQAFSGMGMFLGGLMAWIFPSTGVVVMLAGFILVAYALLMFYVTE